MSSSENSRAHSTPHKNMAEHEKGTQSVSPRGVEDLDLEEVPAAKTNHAHPEQPAQQNEDVLPQSVRNRRMHIQNIIHVEQHEHTTDPQPNVERVNSPAARHSSRDHQSFRVSNENEGGPRDTRGHGALLTGADLFRMLEENDGKQFPSFIFRDQNGIERSSSNIIITVTNITEETAQREHDKLAAAWCFPNERRQAREPQPPNPSQMLSRRASPRATPVQRPVSKRVASRPPVFPRSNLDQLLERTGAAVPARRKRIFEQVAQEENIQAPTEAMGKRERNRAAVIKCRERQRERHELLEQELAELIWENARMRDTIKHVDSLFGAGKARSGAGSSRS